MVRRWMIRALVFVPLVLLAAVWLTSYYAGLGLRKHFRGHDWAAGIVQGSCAISQEGTVYYPPSPLQLTFEPGRTAEEWYWAPTKGGFFWGVVPLFPRSFEVIFPLWLPTLLLLALNWFVWRATRPRLAGRAFPVEPAKKGAG